MAVLLLSAGVGLLLSPRSSIAPRAASPRAASPVAGSHARGSCSRASCAITMGFFDGLFQESEAAKAAKEEEWRAQQEMLARRRNPEKMAEYNAEVVERRREQQMRKAELKAVQKDTSGADTLEAWKALKDEGKVLSSDDMSRDTDTNVLGSKDGLIAERIDENLPYIDQGYVADDAGPDLSKALGDALGGLFGKKDDQR